MIYWVPVVLTWEVFQEVVGQRPFLSENLAHPWEEKQDFVETETKGQNRDKFQVQQPVL